jgi:hypothetical protein
MACSCYVLDVRGTAVGVLARARFYLFSKPSTLAMQPTQHPKDRAAAIDSFP